MNSKSNPNKSLHLTPDAGAGELERSAKEI